MTGQDKVYFDATQRGERFFRFDVLALLLLVFLSYFVRLGVVPVIGEEGRRARGAINMIETGDWIVVQNQGIVFPDRPPMSNWLMAAVGLARGSVDIYAIRLPSAFGVLFTALLLYWYCRQFGSRLEAVVAPAVFVTFGQVLQLGRLGESESVFALFVSASLLLWHLGFAKGWSPTLTWSMGYALAAFGALTKGLQAPVYFVGATAAFLLWQRNWRWLLGRGQWIGACVFLTIVFAWQIPYYVATDWSSVVDTWFALVGPRLVSNNLPGHLVAFPAEVFGSLLPWSPLLLLVGSSDVRRRLLSREMPEQASRATFLVISFVVTFPTLWLSAGAKSRYYMALFPLVAVLIAMIVTHCALASKDESGGRIWRRLMSAMVAGVSFLMAILVCAHVLDGPIAILRPPVGYAVMILLSGLAAVGAAIFARSSPSLRSSSAAILLAALFAGVFYSGPVVSQQAERHQNVGPAVAALRSRIPRPHEMVSFGPIHTKFLYLWGDFVPEIPWPRRLEDLPPEVEYFSFDRSPSGRSPVSGMPPLADPGPGRRIVARGMKFWTTPSTLPFEWLEIAAIDCGRKTMKPPDVEVVIGQVIRDAAGKPVPSMPWRSRIP